jgi:hypothetical protein
LVASALDEESLVQWNSVPAPSGPLPELEIVLVTNSVFQSGSTVSGTIKGFATIDTHDGYAPNPGHPGTGTVTEFTPPSCNSPE